MKLFTKDGEEALVAFKNQTFDALVLDVMMPKKDGFSVAKEIRESDKNIPIIFLTAKSQTKDVVEGFEIGGNDYLKKPFSMEELIVRIQSLLGRNFKKPTTEILSIGKYTLDTTKQVLRFSDLILTLTHRECSLLQFLIENKNQVLDRSHILNAVWNNDDFFSGRSMDVFITKLRKKLNLDPNIQIINVRGQGYKIIS